MDDEYRASVQENVYQNVIQKIADANLIIEDESVLEDDSIVVTVKIGE